MSAAVRLSGDQGLAWAPVDQIHQNGEPTTTCQRTFLRRIRDAAVTDGLSFKIAFEVEFTLLSSERPLRTWPAFSASGLFEVEDFALALVTACEKQGLAGRPVPGRGRAGPVRDRHLRREPLAAADRYVLLRPDDPPDRVGTRLRRLVRSRRWRRPRRLGMAATSTGASGAATVICSPSGDGPLRLSREGEAAVARAARATARDDCAIFCPSVSSYQRLQPGHWCGAYTVLGHRQPRGRAATLARNVDCRASGRQLRAEAARRRRQSLPRRGRDHRRGAGRRSIARQTCRPLCRPTPRRSPMRSWRPFGPGGSRRPAGGRRRACGIRRLRGTCWARWSTPPSSPPDGTNGRRSSTTPAPNCPVPRAALRIASPQLITVFIHIDFAGGRPHVHFERQRAGPP